MSTLGGGTGIHASTFGNQQTKLTPEEQPTTGSGLVELTQDSLFSGNVDTITMSEGTAEENYIFMHNLPSSRDYAKYINHGLGYLFGVYDPRFVDIEDLKTSPELERLKSVYADINERYLGLLFIYLQRVERAEEELGKFLKTDPKLGSKSDLIKEVLFNEIAGYTQDYINFTSQDKGAQLLEGIPERYRQPIRDRLERMRGSGGGGGAGRAISGGQKLLKYLKEFNIIGDVVGTGSGLLETAVTGGYSSEAHKRAEDMSGYTWYKDHIASIPILGDTVNFLIGGLYQDVASSGASFSQAVSGIFGDPLYETDQEKYDYYNGRFVSFVNELKEENKTYESHLDDQQKNISKAMNNLRNDISVKFETDRIARGFKSMPTKSEFAREILNYVSTQTGRRVKQFKESDIKYAQRLMRNFNDPKFQTNMKNYFDKGILVNKKVEETPIRRVDLTLKSPLVL